MRLDAPYYSSRREPGFMLIYFHQSAPQGGRMAKDYRMMLNAMLWVARSGAPWRELPAHGKRYTLVSVAGRGRE
ncbi:transposase [Paenibacillus popilliae]|uniref:transposase n=1 Tax=Paenibacillus popilliae TaxID=78057 RepID=UPI000B896BB7